MSRKTFVYIGAVVGSTIGGFIPAIWGGNLFSVASVFLGGVGGLIGIFVVLKFF